MYVPSEFVLENEITSKNRSSTDPHFHFSMNRASETVVKKAKWLTLLKKVKVPLLATAGVYTATSVYSVHVSQVECARNQLMHEYEISSNLIAELSPGVDINGLSPAHWCCINNDVEGLKLLIKEYCPTQLGLGTISKGRLEISCLG